MAEPIIVPVLNENDETVKLVRWLKQNGERVEKGENVLVVETSKAAVEIEAPGGGFLRVSEAAGCSVRMPATVGFVLERADETVPGTTMDGGPPGVGAAGPPRSGPVVRLSKKAEELLAAVGLDASALPADWSGVVREKQVEEFLRARGKA